MANNYILGNGEKLTQIIAAPPSKQNKTAPYTFEESQTRLLKTLDKVVTNTDSLPKEACPNNESVVAFTLHPSYIAKSYFPSSLFDTLNMTPVGSKGILIKPEKWSRKDAPKETRSLTLFAKASRATIDELPQRLRLLNPDSNAGQDLIKIETIEPITAVKRLTPVRTSKQRIKLEVVLHATSANKDGYVIDQFKRYASEFGASVDDNRKIFAQGLCFLPIEAPKEELGEIENYSFLRAIKEMPSMREFFKSSQGVDLKYALPTSEPVEPGLRVAVFDGGVPPNTLVQPWVRSIDTDCVKGYPSYSEALSHGTAVSGALLFGPLSNDKPPEQPYCYIDHYRAYGKNSNGDLPDEFAVVSSIAKVLNSGQYNYASFSIGPSDPIKDGDDVSLWTSVLDEIFAKKKILATLAVGNDGDKDWASGKARIQPPGDAVNGLSVGSTDIEEGAWQRADYSCIGPGRIPGIVKPDILTYGGSDSKEYQLIDAFNDSRTRAGEGTSFASPTAMRTAMGVQAYFGEVLTPIGLKALLVHHADSNGIDMRECGWGRIPLDFKELMASSDSSYKVAYQGTLSAASWLRVPIPMPSGDIKGKVTIRATIAYFTDTDPKDSYNYTKSGIEVRFRPHAENYKQEPGMPRSTYAKSKSFFQKSQLELYDDPLTHNAHFWETVLCAQHNYYGSSLKDPVFDIHYNARSGGAKAGPDTPDINYAIVITVSAPKEPNLYDRVVNTYPILTPIRPRVEIPIST